MILINYKTYKESFQEKGLELAKIIKETGEKYKIRMAVAATALEARKLIEESGIEVWLQDVSEYADGQHTGWTSMVQAEKLGIKGSLLNHSEHKIAKGTVLKIVERRPKDFQLILCQASLGQIEKWGKKTKTDWILYEPPELIASATKSVADRPEIIRNAAEKCGKIPLMVGAGIKNRNDVAASLKMGAKGICLSSAVVLSQNPKEVLEELAEGFISV